MKFKLGNREYDIKLTYGAAMTTYPDKFGINILSLFEDNNLDNLLTQMLMNDQLALDLLEHYTADYLDTPALIKALDEDPSSLQKFKDVWWEALMDFFGHPRSEILRSLLKEAPKLLKKGVQDSLSNSFDSGSSSSQASQE